ncbi:MAG: hypothetical protein K0U39_07900 [Alphaproteobacteria bacterium]|nr:hypothetical protein [Alphaproteobacteria bacterium]
MVYDVENLFTLRPERPTLPQAPARKQASATQSFVDFSENLRPADTVPTNNVVANNANNATTANFNVPNISANSPFNVEAAFTRLNNILTSSNQNQLQQNYSGRGSIFNVVV